MIRHFCTGNGHRALFVLAACCWLIQLPAQQRRFRLPPELVEVSGLVVVSPDSLWWHNDGGDQARLLLTDGRGRLLHTVALPGAVNRDWEDLTIDPVGRLYIGDFGDNRRSRNDLAIYRYHPHTGALDSFRFSYPQDRHYDVEAFFWHRDSLHLFTKDRLSGLAFTTHHFALPDHSAAPVVAQWRDSLNLRRRVVTGAALRAQGGEVALVAYNFGRWLGFIPHSSASLFVLSDYPDGRYLRGQVRRRRMSCIIATQYESVDFIPNSPFVLTASEKTLFIPAKARRFRLRALRR
jgi:hypothetical protein